MLRFDRLIAFLAAVLVVRVVVEVVAGYRFYFPPDFSTGFLHGRRPHFAGLYWWAFHAHILSGPPTLLLGLVLVSDRLRALAPAAHRLVGRIQVVLILLFVVPSGLVMAPHAAAGPVASAGLASLAVATGAAAMAGATAAWNRRFARHRRWMWRCYLLLCSAVVLRLLGGLGVVLVIPWAWYDPLISWLCWIAPLAAFELLQHRLDHPSRRISTANPDLSARS